MHVIDRARQTIREHDLADANTRVVAAVSGGSDSVALAHILHALHGAGELRLVGIAHFNHQLRSTAVDDERCAAAVAASLGVMMLVEREDVAARASRERRSIEYAARTARHDFFERARTHFDADVVALAHTRDDQAETVLLRLMRGAGPRGLAAMYPRKGHIIRPLLDVRRQDLRAWLDARGIVFVEDETNADVTIPRNRIRAELLPLLIERFNPSIVDVLADEADIAREVWKWMSGAAESFKAFGSDELDIEALKSAPLALRRLIVWKAMQSKSGGRPISLGHIDSALRLMDMDSGGQLDAPGQRVERAGSVLVLTSRPPGTRGRWSHRNLFSYPLSIPGETSLPDAGCVVSAESGVGVDAGGATVSSGDAARAIAIVRGDLCRGPLTVRNRRPGDRFTPIGLAGRKKLQDFFVDRKVPRRERDRVPLVVDESERIVWVAGHGIDEAFRVTDPAQAVVIFKVRRV